MKNITVEINDFGKIRFKLAELMEAKGVNRNQLSTMANVRFEVADKWYRGEVEKMDLYILAKFCYVLECCVSDIIEYCE